MNVASSIIRASIAFGLALVTPAAEAQSAAPSRMACAERTQVVERLAEKYGETRQSMGMHQNSGVLEVYASPSTGSWTILVTMPDGKACLVAAGQYWESNAQPLTPQGTSL